MFKKSLIGVVLGVLVAVGIASGGGSEPIIPEAKAQYQNGGGFGNTWCETCFGLYICTTSTVGGVCSITLGRCRTTNSCTPGGGGIWSP